MTDDVITPLLQRKLLLASSASVLLATDEKRSNLILSDLSSLQSSLSSEGRESERGGDFEQFWAVYPKKIGKGAAFASWKKMGCANGLVERICLQVQAASKTEQWQREGGKFIPLPATWLNQSRWEDDYSQATPVKSDGFKERMQKLAQGKPL